MSSRTSAVGPSIDSRLTSPPFPPTPVVSLSGRYFTGPEDRLRSRTTSRQRRQCPWS